MMRGECFKARVCVLFLLQLDFITAVMKSHPNCPPVISQLSSIWPDVAERREEDGNFLSSSLWFVAVQLNRAQRTGERGGGVCQWQEDTNTLEIQQVRRCTFVIQFSHSLSCKLNLITLWLAELFPRLIKQKYAQDHLCSVVLGNGDTDLPLSSSLSYLTLS